MEEDISEILLNWIFVRTKPSVVSNKAYGGEWTLASFEIYLLGLSFTITVFMLVGYQMYSGCIDFICQPLFEILSVNPTPLMCHKSQTEPAEPTFMEVMQSKCRAALGRKAKRRKNVLFRPTRRVLSYVDTRSVFLMDEETDTPDAGIGVYLDMCRGGVWADKQAGRETGHLGNKNLPYWDPKLQDRGDYDGNEDLTGYDELMLLSHTGTSTSALSNFCQITERPAQGRGSPIDICAVRSHTSSVKSGEATGWSRSSLGLLSQCTSSTLPASISSKRKVSSGVILHKRARLSRMSKSTSLSTDTHYDSSGHDLYRSPDTDAETPGENVSKEILRQVMGKRLYGFDGNMGSASSHSHGDWAKTVRKSAKCKARSRTKKSDEDEKLSSNVRRRDHGKVLDGEQEKGLKSSENSGSPLFMGDDAVTGISSPKFRKNTNDKPLKCKKISIEQKFVDTDLPQTEVVLDGQRKGKATGQRKSIEQSRKLGHSPIKEKATKVGSPDLEFEKKDRGKSSRRMLKDRKTSFLGKRIGKGKRLNVGKPSKTKSDPDKPAGTNKGSVQEQLPPITSGHELQLRDTSDYLFDAENDLEATSQQGPKPYVKECTCLPPPRKESETPLRNFKHSAKQETHKKQLAPDDFYFKILENDHNPFSENTNVLATGRTAQEKNKQNDKCFPNNKKGNTVDSMSQKTHISLMPLLPTSIPPKAPGAHYRTVKNLREPQTFMSVKHPKTKEPGAAPDGFNNMYDKDKAFAGDYFSNSGISTKAKSKLPPKPTRTKRIFHRNNESENTFRDYTKNSQESTREPKSNKPGLETAGTFQRRHGNTTLQRPDTLGSIQTFLWGKQAQPPGDRTIHDQDGQEPGQEIILKPWGDQEAPTQQKGNVYRHDFSSSGDKVVSGNGLLARPQGGFLSVKQNPNLEDMSCRSKIPLHSPPIRMSSPRAGGKSTTEETNQQAEGFGWLKTETAHDRKILSSYPQKTDQQMDTRKILHTRKDKVRGTKTPSRSSQSSPSESKEKVNKGRESPDQGVKDINREGSSNSRPPRQKSPRFKQFTKGDRTKTNTQQNAAVKGEIIKPPTTEFGWEGHRKDLGSKRRLVRHTVPSHRVHKRTNQGGL